MFANETPEYRVELLKSGAVSQQEMPVRHEFNHDELASMRTEQTDMASRIWKFVLTQPMQVFNCG